LAATRFPTINIGANETSETGSSPQQVVRRPVSTPDPTKLVQLPRINDGSVGRRLGGGRATPMVDPAPVTFSMTVGWPSDTRMRSLQSRPSVSVGAREEQHDHGDGCDG
jgi:hypothetical protein